MAGAGDVETVTVIRPTGRDRYGDPLPGCSESDLDGCLVAPGGSFESPIGANTVTADLTIYAPPGVDVLPADQIRVRGEVFSVLGAVQRWGNVGVVIELRRVAG